MQRPLYGYFRDPYRCWTDIWIIKCGPYEQVTFMTKEQIPSYHPHNGWYGVLESLFVLSYMYYTAQSLEFILLKSDLN